MTIRSSPIMALRSARLLPMNQSLLQRKVSAFASTSDWSSTRGISMRGISIPISTLTALTDTVVLSRGTTPMDSNHIISMSRGISLAIQQQQQQQQQQRRQNVALSPSYRWFSSSSSSSDNDDNDHKTTDAIPQIAHDVEYVSPLGGLISRLKMVSITGCFLSVCVFPALVYLKQGDLPNAQQTTMGTIATLSATGSTAALQFVFGAYVLEMKTIDVVGDVAAVAAAAETDDDDDDDNSETENTNSRRMLEAKTRSVFGFWKNTHVFDPTKDVEPYQGHRPFANFSANGIPLYVHPDKLDSITKQLLLSPSSSSSKNSNNNSNSETETTKETNDNNTEMRDHEGLAIATKKKKKKEDDDDFF